MGKIPEIFSFWRAGLPKGSPKAAAKISGRHLLGLLGIFAAAFINSSFNNCNFLYISPVFSLFPDLSICQGKAPALTP